VLAPLAVSVADAPLQIGDGVGTVITGIGFMVIETCTVSAHPLLSVPITVIVGGGG
jgi:hypothetical protein